MSLFKTASMKAYRFPSTKGLLSTEDLWGLTLTQLNKIAKDINKKAKESEDEISFIPSKSNKINNDLSNMLKIVIEVIEHKVDYQERVIKSQETKKKKEFLLNLIEKKEGEAMNDMSIEELKKAVEELA